MADLGIFIKTLFNPKGVNEAKKAFDDTADSAEKMSARQKKASKQARDEFGRFIKGGTDGGKKLKLSFGNLGNVAKDTFGQLSPAALAGPAAAIAALATGVVSLAVGSLKLAEQAKVATSSFTSLSGSANIARLNLQAMGRATKGLISETEQMKIANQLLGMNIVQTADQLEEVVGVSRRLGKEFRGLGARDAAEEFAIMIANMSVARLDSFGLSSGRVRKRILELIATTEGMTREMAFFQATMEEGQATIERLGPEINTTSDEVSRMAAEWANLRVVMGEAAEGTGILKGLAAGISDNLILLRNWSEAGSDVNTQQQALEIQIKRTQAEIEDNTTGWIKNAGAATRNRVKLAELQDQYAAVTNEIEASTAAAKKEQDAFQAAIALEEERAALLAESTKKREEQAKTLARVQEQFSRDVINIQEDTQDQLLDSQEQFGDDRAEVIKDNLKKIANLRARAVKADLKGDAKLAKAKAKVNVNLGKSLIKQQLDEDKKIAKTKANFIKDDRKQDQRRKIDAAGDERLFQFELRNLAADGQGIAIKQALERREIEQEIASEKAEFQKKTEQESRRDTVDGMRQEGQEARSQLRQQAEERRSDLELRNQEAAESRAERLQEELTQEAESFAQKKADLNEALTERNEKIRESENERVQEIAKALTETEDLTSASLENMIELARQFGPEFGTIFATGMTEAFTENLKIDAAIAKTAENIGAGVSGLPLAQAGTTARTTGGRIGGLPQFQGGGVIGRSGIAFVDANEEIANPAIGQSITIGDEQFAVREAGRLAGAINAMRQRDMQELVDTVAANL